MLIWIKSLIDDMSAGTLLVAASMALVIALLIALGEVASRAPEADLLLGSGTEDTYHRGRDAALTPVAATAPAADHSGGRSSVSIMVPVGTFR